MWEEAEELARYFHGKNLNDDGIDGDYGFCHFPRKGLLGLVAARGRVLHAGWASGMDFLRRRDNRAPDEHGGVQESRGEPEEPASERVSRPRGWKGVFS